MNCSRSLYRLSEALRNILHARLLYDFCRKTYKYLGYQRINGMYSQINQMLNSSTLSLSKKSCKETIPELIELAKSYEEGKLGTAINVKTVTYSIVTDLSKEEVATLIYDVFPYEKVYSIQEAQIGYEITFVGGNFNVISRKLRRIFD